MSTLTVLLIGIGIGLALTYLLRHSSVVRLPDQPSSMQDSRGSAPATDLEHLQQLFASGTLTQAEYDALKTRLVDNDQANTTGLYTVTILTGSGNKIRDIKAIRELTHLGLKQAKDIADSLPQRLATNLTRPEADRMKRMLEAAGITARIH